MAAVSCRPAMLQPVSDPGIDDRARLLRIADTRRDEPRFLDSALAAASPGVRSLAALTAGRIGGTAHLAPLRSLAAGRDPAVAGDALFALALLKDSASRSLAAAGLHREPLVAERGAWLLGELGEAARGTLVTALGNPALAGTTRAALLLAAARLKPIPAAAVVPWLQSPDSAITWRAAYVLARGRSADGVRPLLAVVGSMHAEVREQAARGLGRPVAGDSLADSARAALHRLASDPAPHVRVNAIRALATYGVPAAGDVQRALADTDAAVRLTAAQSLVTVLGADGTTWQAALRTDTAFVVQRAVLDGAVRQGQAALVPATWRTSGEWQRRAAVAELDGVGPAAATLPRVAAWTRDGDGRVRAAAWGAVAALADSAVTRDDTRAMLRTALRDADVDVRAVALAALAGRATVDDLDAALDAYERSRTDRDNDARLAFWMLADSALRRTPALPPALEGRVAGLASPADPLERAAAAMLPRFSAWNDRAGTARPLAWYHERVRESVSPRRPLARVQTERGTMELELLGADAPLTVYNFVTLARSGYFDGQRFHRVVPNFVAQGGDPRGDGNGGPGYAIRDEINPHRYDRGTLGMALSGPNTGGSQFFITHSPQPHLDGGYTVFGQLRSGGEVLDRIVQGDRIVRITIH